MYYLTGVTLEVARRLVEEELKRGHVILPLQQPMVEHVVYPMASTYPSLLHISQLSDSDAGDWGV